MRSAPEAAATGRAVSTARLSGLDMTAHSGTPRNTSPRAAASASPVAIQRDVEVASEHAGGIESCLSVSDEENVHHYHA